jgi:uncharacterized RDD family membrane protein YckC
MPATSHIQTLAVMATTMTVNISGQLFQYSPSWKRILAQAIDFGLLGLFFISMDMIFLIPVPMIKWTLFLIYMTYGVLFDYHQHGTIGKQIMKIKILKTYDHRTYLLTILYRNFIKAIMTILVFEAVLLLLIPYRQGFHNHIAKCAIVDYQS